MFKWASYPFLRITFSLCIGIVLAHFFPGFYNPVKNALVFNFLIFVLFFLILRRKYFYKGNFVIGITCLSFFFLLGYYLYAAKRVNEGKQLSKLPKNEIEYYEVEINEVYKGKNGYDKLIGTLTTFRSAGEWRPFGGKTLINIKEDSLNEGYRIGDKIIVKGHPKHVPKPANPGEFDYKQYLSLQGIYLSNFSAPEHIIVYENSPPSWFKLYPLLARQKIELILNKFIKGEQEKEILRALILGDKSKLDDQLQNAYVSAGAMHILAVSGLHVGIIFSILQIILSPLKRGRKTKFAFAAISISVLVFYAFLSGLSPSVCRAVLMTSLIIVSQVLKRKSNIYNTLAVAAFFLLIYDPYQLFSVGFQLSFIAVLGIVYLQPRIFNSISIDNKVFNYVWYLISVTLAAQIAVMPLALHYFHIFPVYFLLANLPLIFMAYIILSGGFLLIVTALLPIVPMFIGLLLEWVVKTTNTWVMLFQDMPSITIDNIYISEFQTVLIYVILFVFFMFIYSKKFHQLVLFFLFIAAFSTSKFYHVYKRAQEKQIVFYSISGGGALGLFNGNDFCLFSPSDKDLLQKKLDYHIKPHLIQKGIRLNENKFEAAFIKEFEDMKLFVWNGKTFLILNEPIKKFLQIPFFVDYLLVSNNAVKDMKLIEGVDFGKIILDSSNSNYLVNRFINSELSHKHFVHSLSLHGAFVENIN